MIHKTNLKTSLITAKKNLVVLPIADLHSVLRYRLTKKQHNNGSFQVTVENYRHHPFIYNRNRDHFRRTCR
jgi:hypothetical protein